MSAQPPSAVPPSLAPDRLLATLGSWNPPSTWLRLMTIDAHAAGEPLRVVVSGLPGLPGGTMLERRRYMRETLDHLRTALMWEPRGHREMYGCILTPPVNPGADFGVLFLHNEGYSTMCGHGIIAVATVAVETGLVAGVEPETMIRIDSPAGPVAARVRLRGGRAQSVCFRNVPSFVLALDQTISIADLGKIRYDLAFGGAFYAYVQAGQLGFRCLPDEVPAMVDKGMQIKRAIMRERAVEHPVERELGFLYGTIFIAPPIGEGADSRNVCIFAEGEVDRSPTGTGVSGRMAIHHARGEIGTGQSMVIESVIGSRFTGRIVETVNHGGLPAVIPEVEGSAFLTGQSEFWLDPADPLCHGFLL